MVRIQVKSKHKEDEEELQFLYDCPSTTRIKEIARAVIEISNLQIKINRLALALESGLIQLGDGKGIDSNEAVPLMRALSEAKAYASKDQVLHGRILSPHILRDHIQTIEKQVTVNKAVGLSDLTQLHQRHSGSCTDSELLQEDTTQLLWAGKELMNSKRLCDYVGDNDKTKIMLRLQPSCLSSP
ncbi:cilia- and flagella-associated protein 298-like [Macadamia integrifolia]|uniref:cilia- and flagella-associated protein 298-like n=1 Tax=Macadamia integrifolia TaxID=60698 RepID=UPI001C52B68C|nr:cilia- and flagella-associated protein 298-like [Macadamia integrifolia]